MSKLRVLVANGDMLQKALDLLKEKFEVIVASHSSRQDILAKASGVDAILWCTKEKLNAEVLDKAGPNLKVVATMSAGYDQIDVPELKRRNIKFGNTPNVLNASVAEVAVLLMLATAHRLHEGRLAIEQDKWQVYEVQWMLGQEIQGSTVGIVGFGGIGQAIAKRLIPFDVAEILYSGHSPKPEAKELGAQFVSFEELLKRSDFIVIACPLTQETKEMFNEGAFKKMKGNSILINIARGGVVDQNALIKALKEKWIWGAGLDVTTPEPLPANSPLLKLPNCAFMLLLESSDVAKWVLSGGGLRNFSRIILQKLRCPHQRGSETPWDYGSSEKVVNESNTHSKHVLSKILLPHLGSATIKTRTGMALLAARNVIAGLEGKPLPAEV